MKFTEHLAAHITPEWRKQYIGYEEMKAMLYVCSQEAPSPDTVETEVSTRYFAAFDEKFFTFCDNELTKINTFYSEKLAEATRKFAALKSELHSAHEHHNADTQFFGFGFKKKEVIYRDKIPSRKRGDLKLAFSEYYLSLVLLQNYQNLNYTGFRKILKKHDKILNTSSGLLWRNENVENAHFYSNKDIGKLILNTENTFINDLESGDRQKAMKRLRVPPLGNHHSSWTTFKVGLFSGAFIVLFFTVIISSVFYEYESDRSDWKLIVRLYRGPLILIVFLFLLGINVYGWRSSGVNHVLIFELDPRNHLSEQHLMELASIFGVIWTLSVLMFLFSHHLSIPTYANPLALLIIMALVLFNPTKTFRHDARFWILRVLGRIVMAPLFYVGFADFWIADQLNSLAPVLVDFQYIICFYSNANVTISNEWKNSGDDSQCMNSSNWIKYIIYCLPAWFRFAQCLRRFRDTKEPFPHLLNAGKYSTTLFTVLFSSLSSNKDNDHPFFYLWILSALLNSLYGYVWDIKMDWGLFDKNAGEYTFLREGLVYSSKNFYYFAILEDLILRFSWAISFGITKNHLVDYDIMQTIKTFLEVFRRFIWNFFRLENEHLNNCGQFRAVRDISVAPIDTSDQSHILRMMDEKDGVYFVRKRKNNKIPSPDMD